MDVRKIAHDMRTPLNALSLTLRNARNARAPEELLRSLEIADRNVKAIKEIVESLLDTVANDEGRLTFRECVPKDIVAAAIDQIAPQAEIKGLELVATELTDLPPLVADGTRLVRILVNLLSNAVRFSPEHGRIVVRARLRENDGRRVMVFSVIDQGPGVLPEHILPIFSEGVSFAKGGKYSSGLGLSTSKELVEAHGGTLWVELDRKDGATFSFSIPTDLPLLGD